MQRNPSREQELFCWDKITTIAMSRKLSRRDTIEGVAIFNDDHNPDVDYAMALKENINKDYVDTLYADKLKEVAKELKFLYISLPSVRHQRCNGR